MRSGDWQGEGSVTVITVAETFSPPDMASDPLLPPPEVSPVWQESVSSNTGQAADAGAPGPGEESASFTASATLSDVWHLGLVMPSTSPACNSLVYFLIVFLFFSSFFQLLLVVVFYEKK